MYSIKMNNKTMQVPAEIVLEYLKYRKLKNGSYYYGMEETLAMYVENILHWANNIKKLNTSFPEIEQQLEKIEAQFIYFETCMMTVNNLSKHCCIDNLHISLIK